MVVLAALRQMQQGEDPRLVEGSLDGNNLAASQPTLLCMNSATCTLPCMQTSNGACRQTSCCSSVSMWLVWLRRWGVQTLMLRSRISCMRCAGASPC